MLRIVLLQCVVGFAWSFPEGGKCNSLPALMKNIAEQDHASLAAQCRRHLGLRDCEQLFLSVGKGPWDEEVREKACRKIADLLRSRNLMDTPLDEVASAKKGEEIATDAIRVSTVPPVDLPTVAPLPAVELVTVPPVELVTVPPVELVTVPPVELPTVAPLPAVTISTVAPMAASGASTAGQAAEGAREESSQVQPAAPGLLHALGQTFVSPSASMTPEQREGHQGEEDRPSWLARSADRPDPLDAVAGTAVPPATTGAPARPVAEALRGAASGVKALSAGRGEADGSSSREEDQEEQPSWRKEQLFHERETEKAKGPFGVNLEDFISSHANEDPSAPAAPEAVDTGGRSNEEWMESKFDLHREVVDTGAHKMLLWGFLFVALVSFTSSLVIRWRPSAPTAYSRLEAQVPFSSSRQVRVA